MLSLGTMSLDLWVIAVDPLCSVYFSKFFSINTQYNSTNAHSYKVVMYIQKLHPFCDTFFPDDGPKLGRKYLGNN